MSLSSEETAFIEALKNKLPPTSEGVVCGIGDDAAIVSVGPSLLVFTTDMLVEGVHFSLDYFTAADVGYKALAVNLSDIAAMGAKPLYALTSLAIPPRVSKKAVEEIYDGLGALACRYNVSVIGGNLSSSPSSLILDVTLVGSVTEPLYRTGAKKGDWVAVSGPLGLSAAGLIAFETHRKEAVNRFPTACRQHLRPHPRVEMGPDLVGKVNCAMDISDGLSSDLRRLAEASCVGIELYEAKLTVEKEVEALARQSGRTGLDLVLHGGEDYELLACVEGKVAETTLLEWGLTAVGRVISDEKPGVELVQTSGKRVELAPLGWDHFRGK